MKKILINLIAFSYLLITQSIYCQDTIILKNDTRINAKIIEIETDNIKYKKANYVDGPTINLSKSEINSIIYFNGDVEEFNNFSNNKTIENPIPVYNINQVIINKDYKLILNKVGKLTYELSIIVNKAILENNTIQSNVLFNFIFVDSRKNFNIDAFRYSDNTFSTTFRGYSEGSFKRYERLKEYPLSKIEIPLNNNSIVIDISEDAAIEINKMFFELYPNEFYGF
jgi:hypothetical protein